MAVGVALPNAPKTNVRRDDLSSLNVVMPVLDLI
jgi:hypothetical protein